MSELISTATPANARRHLLATTSALVCLTTIYGAHADEASRPTIWIELGGQLETLSKVRDPISAPFVDEPQSWIVPNPIQAPSAPLITTAFPSPFDASSPRDLQKPLEHSVGGEGKIVLHPQHSDWQFALALRFGRSNGKKSGGERVEVVPDAKYPQNMANPFWHSQNSTHETHAILDFEVGHDVGFGLFGKETTATVDAGVRFAQFTSKFAMNVGANPEVRLYGPIYGYKKYDARFHTFTQNVHDQRSFHGMGPSLSWSASTPFAGTQDDMEVAFDWGVNGAVLFGRQKTEVVQMTVANDRFKDSSYSEAFHALLYNRTIPHIRSRSVTVPNVGAFAALSLKFPNATVSVGYRGDFFFNAMDGGLNESLSRDTSFHGPFASLAVGL